MQKVESNVSTRVPSTDSIVCLEKILQQVYHAGSLDHNTAWACPGRGKEGKTVIG